MTTPVHRPMLWCGAALAAQTIGVFALAVLQRAAFVVPASLGEASAISIGYAVLIAASGTSVVSGSLAAFSAIESLSTWRAAALVTLLATPLIFIGVAELYATLAMLCVF